MSAPFKTPGVFLVDPSRLASGAWCHTKDRQIGEGDIHASYSADKIGLEGKVRRPFSWQNGLWTCTSIRTIDREATFEAYCLIPAAHFGGTPEPYGKAIMNSAARRECGKGFYHGMLVRHANREFVLVGPPIQFCGNNTEQLSLL